MQLKLLKGVDKLNRIVNLNAEVLQGLGINDYKTIGALIEKNKDRKGFEQYKYYGTLIDKILGKVDNVALRDGTDTVNKKLYLDPLVLNFMMVMLLKVIHLNKHLLE
ncbi:MAG: hypothetical protein CM15mV76_410 [uncultured marine virus]|nr:MAG: hypothetical protein CM15mV76_410 [uncultured marine virus]